MDIPRLTDMLMEARAASKQLVPFSKSEEGFSLPVAYAIANQILKRRVAGGENVVGRKIGFTNRNIWPHYGVYAPIWGTMYDKTVRYAKDNKGVQSLKGALEPRIEPEIVLKLSKAPRPEADVEELATCIEWVAHGYEIVVSFFPQWKFAASDTVAAFGLHGTLIVGTPVPAKQFPHLAETLANFKISLHSGGDTRDTGAGANVLGSPLHALHHLAMTLKTQPQYAPLAKGDIITTGTLTNALPIKAGETWSTKLEGIALPGLSVKFV
jgi:2-keto-4-pentenoate hydratase